MIVFLAANSANFLFHQPYYEWWDSAANSLSILRAKHFAQLYGPYSRFEFYHPNPAIFYFQALGEWLCYDLAHAVPTPFQGQVLITLCLMVGFYVGALSIFAHWLPASRRWVFLCAALFLGLLHFSWMSNLSSTYDQLGGGVGLPQPLADPHAAHAVPLFADGGRVGGARDADATCRYSWPPAGS